MPCRAISAPASHHRFHRKYRSQPGATSRRVLDAIFKPAITVQSQSPDQTRSALAHQRLTSIVTAADTVNVQLLSNMGWSKKTAKLAVVTHKGVIALLPVTTQIGLPFCHNPFNLSLCSEFTLKSSLKIQPFLNHVGASSLTRRHYRCNCLAEWWTLRLLDSSPTDCSSFYQPDYQNKIKSDMCNG